MKKKITALLLACCLLLGGCGSSEAPSVGAPTTTTKSDLAAFLEQMQNDKSHFDNASLTAAERDSIIASRKLKDPYSVPALKINGVEAVYEADSDSYFFTVAHDDVWEELALSLDGYETAYTTKLEKGEKEDFIADGTAAEVLAYTNDVYMTLRVVFTTLPVMAIDTQTLPSKYVYHDHDEEVDLVKDSNGDYIPYDPYAAPSTDIDKPIGDYETFLQMRLLDADAKKHGYDNGLTLMARAHLRGRSSRQYPKNSYKLELLKEENGVLVEKNETLLGMRRDGDWNLNGMYAEPTKVRDKVASDIWLAMTADRAHEGFSTGYRCEYIELIVNGHYHGLYLLTERIDQKQVGLDDGDLMYFSEGDLGKTHLDFLNVTDKYDMEVAGYSLKWPKERSAPYDEWTVFGELTKLVQASNGATFKAEAGDMINVDSLIDYELFVQTVVGRDNIIQNTYYVAYQQEDGSYQFSFIPWDLDQTFGQAWSGDLPLLTYENYDGNIEWEGNFWITTPFERTDAEQYNARLKARYAELRETVLSDEEILKFVNSAHAQITDSGAFARNRARWPKGGYASKVTALRSFIGSRMDYLDSYYG